MQKLFVPTDFSECADHAFEVALQVAHRVDGVVTLYHHLNIPEGWEVLTREAKEIDEENKALVDEALEKLKALASTGLDRSVEMNIAYGGGEFLKDLQNKFNAYDAELIVMGSHGVSGKEEWFIGSNAQKVIRKLHNNVLVIKESIEMVDFRKILFASNLESRDQTTFKAFLDFVTPYNPEEVHVLAVNTSGFFRQPTVVMNEALKDFEKLAGDFQCFSHFIRDYSVEAGIRHFCENVGIDLIGISNHERHPIKRMFQGSNVEMLVNHSKVPVLSLDYKQLEFEP